MDMLFPYTCVALAMATPITLNLYLKPRGFLTAVFMATNLAPTLISIVAWYSECLSAKAVSMYIKKPLRDYLVCLSSE